MPTTSLCRVRDVTEDVKPKGRWWAFDRPVLRDPLFWLALAAGALFALTMTSGALFAGRPAIQQAGSLILRLLLGFFVAAALGGAVRNFWRGYRGG